MIDSRGIDSSMFLDCLLSSPSQEILGSSDDSFGLSSDFPAIYCIVGGLLLQGRSIAMLKLKPQVMQQPLVMTPGAQWQLALFLLEDLRDAQLQPNQAPC